MVEIFEGEKKIMDSEYIYDNYYNVVFILDVFEKNLQGGHVRGYALGKCSNNTEDIDKLVDSIESKGKNLCIIPSKSSDNYTKIDISECVIK